MNNKKILVIGGTGFLGTVLTRLLASRGYHVTVPTRRRERAKHLIVFPTVDVVEVDVNSERQLSKLVIGQDAVINLVGILQSRRAGLRGKPYKKTHRHPFGLDFLKAHVELPRKIYSSCRQHGVRRVIQVSSLKADLYAPSEYLRSKAAGETVLRAAKEMLELTIFRPSIIFGAGDSFLNLYARLLKWFPFFPVACPNTRFQPVFVEDVAASIADSVFAYDTYGKAFDLCGPDVFTLKELVEYVGEVSGHRRPVIGLSDRLSYLQAWFMEFVPGKIMSRDNYRSLQVDSVCAGNCMLPFGRKPTVLKEVVPTWLGKSPSKGAVKLLNGE